jgi:DNA repair exonuclease SbcCD ATPase subunit
MEKEEIVTQGIQVPPYAKIKVYWDDKPENYSRESRNRVKKYFANKYGIPPQSVNVVYRPVKVNKNGETIKIDGATIDNIMNTTHQRELFKEWLTRENKDVDFKRIVALDEKVNGELNIDLEEKMHRKYRLKWLTVNNFLSYGEGNYFPVDKFKGFTVVNSNPANQGGKTTLTIDAVKFLFFGKTTKTDTNSEVFNTYNDATDLKVRGLIEIEGEENIIIERHLTRKPKRKGGYNITNKVNFYKLLPDGDEEELNDEDARKTTELIKETVGTEKDFDLVVLATSRNLDSLVDSTAGESGKLLTRFIGLEVIALKEAAARKMHSTYSKTMKSNIYDIETLKEEIGEHKKALEFLAKQDVEIKTQLETEKAVQKKHNDKKIELVGTKHKIDAEILSMNPSKLEGEISAITEKGITAKKEIEAIETTLKKIGKVEFDEDRHFQLIKGKDVLNTDIGVKEAEVVRLTKVVEDLIAGGICKACNRKLDDVDNTAHIAKHNKEIKLRNDEVAVLKTKLKTITDEITSMADTKKKIDNKNKEELKKDRLEVEMDSLRVQLKEKNGDLKKYNENLEAIEGNKKIDIEISQVDTKIAVCENKKEELNATIQQYAIDTNFNTKEIATKEALIVTINKEKEVDTLFKIYVEMVGKKGISKLVLRSVLPIINGELQRLLEDITDFEVEVFIDDKNEVRYLLVKDGIEKPLKSGSGFELTAASIALRCVLGKMSSLPTPNFITFDEVLGRVAPENIPNMKPLFERISEMFDIVFFITQITEVKDWGSSIITVNKENNISKIKIT